MFANRNEVLTLAFQLLFKDDNMQQIARTEKNLFFLSHALIAVLEPFQYLTFSSFLLNTFRENQDKHKPGFSKTIILNNPCPVNTYLPMKCILHPN